MVLVKNFGLNFLLKNCRMHLFMKLNECPFFRRASLIDWNSKSIVVYRAWYGMERKMEWNGTQISVWNMEEVRMEWNGRFQEWNGRQSSILPYQFHTRFCALYSQKNTYQFRVVINNIVTEVFNFKIYAYYLSTNRGTLAV